jgi:hypothetical protein
MSSEKLAVARSKILIFLKDFWEFRSCDQCSKDHGGVSCEIYPGSQKRIVTICRGILDTRLVLTPPRDQCLAEDAGFYEKGKLREDELNRLRDELRKITPNHSV